MTKKTFSSLHPYTLDLIEHSLRWMDQRWDAEAALLSMSSYERLSSLPVVHHIRVTSWYALGLLQRGAAGDKERACSALQAVLKYQFDEPGKAYDGTWYRFPQESHPGDMPIWKGYDPNWREFIGTTLAIILLDYEQELPATLVQAIDEALRKAIRGALTRNLSAGYSNIALMHAFLLLFAGERFNEPACIQAGEAFALEVYRLFTPTGAFAEFNSPTYYGIDLYALGLWRTYATSVRLQRLGAEMETALWKDIALMYHADMKNMAGPYDRSYGVDMMQYATTIGMWIWMVVGREAAPFPDITRPFAHSHDFCIAPCYAAVDVKVPHEVLQHLQSFTGERRVERIITQEPRRVATAWIGRSILVGGEETDYSAPASDQFHPATLHWRDDQNRISWIRLVYTAPVSARAEKHSLSISALAQGGQSTDFVFQIYAPARSAEAIQQHFWQLPGLSAHIEANARLVAVRDDGDVCEVRYSASDAAPGAIITLKITIQGEAVDAPKG